jgi:hypothetical protein
MSAPRYFAVEETTNHRRHLVELVFERKVPGVEDMKLRMRKIPKVGMRARFYDRYHWAQLPTVVRSALSQSFAKRGGILRPHTPQSISDPTTHRPPHVADASILETAMDYQHSPSLNICPRLHLHEHARGRLRHSDAQNWGRPPASARSGCGILRRWLRFESTDDGGGSEERSPRR